MAAAVILAEYAWYKVVPFGEMEANSSDPKHVGQPTVFEFELPIAPSRVHWEPNRRYDPLEPGTDRRLSRTRATLRLR